MTLPSGAGQTDAAHSVSVVMASDAASPALPTGSATSAKQDTIIASLGTIDGHVDGLEASATSIDGKIPAKGQATAANSTPVVPSLSASTDAGQNLSLADTNSHPFGTSAVAQIGVMVSAPLANTAPVYVGLATGVTSGATGKGIELQPGDREFFPVPNANLIYCITGTATQNVHALAI